MAVDVVLVNPPSPDGHLYIRDVCRRTRKSREGMLWPQLCLAYPAAILRAKGYRVVIRDCIAERDTEEDFRRWLDKHRPRYYVTLLGETTLRSDARWVRVARTLGAHTIGLGTMVTSSPREAFAEIPELEVAALREPEETVAEIVDCWEDGRELAGVKGVALRDGGQVAMTPERPLVDLGKLPLPAQDLLPLDKYRMPLAGRRYTYVLVERGCPHRCTFCVESALWHGEVRLRPVPSVLEELRWLRALGVERVLFQADLFTVNRAWVLELCRALIREGIGMPWTCNSRVDTVDAELLMAMKEAGCFLIAYGVESGSDEVLRRAAKGTTVSQIKPAVTLTRRAGIRSWGYFVLGLPGETRETLEETIRLSVQLPFDLVLFQALPDKERMELIIQKGTELGVKTIVPFKSKHSISLQEREAVQPKAHRWQAIALKAAKQCRRAIVPLVAPYCSYEGALEQARPLEFKLLLVEKEEERLAPLIRGMPPPKNIALMVGPEGGWDAAEVEQTREEGFFSVGLGGRILRTETAAIAACAILQYEWGGL